MRLLQNILILLTFLLISSIVFGEDQQMPTVDQVTKILEAHPELMVPVYQKLWVLEHSSPVLQLPDLILLKLKENLSEVNDNFTKVKGNLTVVMFEDKPATLKIGNDEFNLLYDIELNVMKVVYTEPYPENTGIPLWGVITIGAGTFCLGFFVGYLIFH